MTTLQKTTFRGKSRKNPRIANNSRTPARKSVLTTINLARTIFCKIFFVPFQFSLWASILKKVFLFWSDVEALGWDVIIFSFLSPALHFGKKEALPCSA